MSERHTTQGGGLASIEARGPDEFDDREFWGHWQKRVRWEKPLPVIAAGVCPACGNYPACGWAPIGYACENRSTT